jgi:GNAT superfamily N-acetyltransferase
MKASIIHPIQEMHLPAVLELIRELAVYEREPEAVSIDEQVLRQALFEEKVAYGWVAEWDGEVVGLAIGYVRFSTWKGPCGYLEDLVVKASHRGKGIGEQLLTTFIDHSRAKGWAYVQWQVLDWNEPAVRFYERMGAQVEKNWWNVRYYLP